MAMKLVVLTLMCIVAVASAHNSYSGGYSGAPGMRTCASSCHGGSAGTMLVTGFPTSYSPGQTYRITIKRNGGSPIVNFNATTRVGSTTSVAGTFAAVSNSALYTGADGGVYASPHAIDSAVFQWTAPARGTGEVTLYAAAFQGTTGSASGQSRSISATATEITTDLDGQSSLPDEYALYQNYPNPFNPTTAISFRLSAVSSVQLSVFDVLGREVAVLAQGKRGAGYYSVQWNASGLPSGIYLYRLSVVPSARRDLVPTEDRNGQAGDYVATRKMTVTK